MQLYAAFHLGLHFLQKYPFRVSSIQRVKFGMYKVNYGLSSNLGGYMSYMIYL